MTEANNNKLKLFQPIALLNGVSLLFQMCIMLISHQGYTIYMLLKKTQSESLSFGSIQYCAVHILLWFMSSVICWFLAINFSKYRRHDSYTALKSALFITAFFNIVVLLANQNYHAYSKFARITEVFFPQSIVETLLYACLLVLAVLAIPALLNLMQWIKRHRMLTANIIVISAVAFYVNQRPLVSEQVATHSPNIIFIGIDSLRPDHVSFFNPQAVKTPTLDNFLKQSVVFNDSVTPLARTFPAWVSILTGLYPIHHGAREDLMDPKVIKTKQSLAWQLKNYGYKTIYSTDDPRFSNIDEAFGFDELIGPKQGVLNFLLTNLNDTPLSNLVMNTFIGRWLFPNIYTSRSNVITYDPKEYVHSIERHLQFNAKQPLFFSMHFCMIHQPFAWDTKKRSKHFPIRNDEDTQILYNETLLRLDQQLKTLLASLKKLHLLDNTFVVLLSDHGDGLNFDGDRLFDLNKRISNNSSISPTLQRILTPDHHTTAIRSLSHGGDVASPSQYHNLLAMRYYGKYNFPAHQVETRVSLFDIAPTVLDFLKMPNSKMDGVSLLPLLNQEKINSLGARFIFFESAYNPVDCYMAKKNRSNCLIDLASRMYHIDNKSSKLFLREKFFPDEILPIKQHAVFYKKWLLVDYPIKKHVHKQIIIDLTTKKWTDDLKSDFARKTPLDAMQNALKKFYGNELTL